MVRKIEIENFKSIQKLDFELGRINVIIGANGSGKSNILEAIAFASCAAENKLDNDYLNLRGIRVTSKGEMMKSGFIESCDDFPIKINFTSNNNTSYEALIEFIGEEYLEWREMNRESDETVAMLDYLKKRKTEEGKELYNKLKEVLNRDIVFHTDFGEFIIYSPETSSLRKFEDDSATEPIGIRGEGLFKLLKYTSRWNPELLSNIKQNLQLLDWFESVEIPLELLSGERRIEIKDKYIGDLFQLDQKAANEGFLYLLFYFTLMVSDRTPKFFAIDNIDNSLNPKLCQALTKRINVLANDFNKQVILTTHNPSILDGLDLNDDEQRLFVAYRNDDGHTKIRRILKPQLSEGFDPVKLSEMFMRGTIGGLPTNF